MYILSWKLSHFVKSTGVAEDTPRFLIIVHLKRLSPDNLEPVHERFNTCVRVEMSIGHNFLLKWNILGSPAKEDTAGNINHSYEDRWI